ncbi:protein TESPA1 [Salarias fasciatus]|uniref:protein TESPA1 n=1 Tax=Salarias fasciatus TaxID=181472 RepID=UPI001176DC2B|nr:protein TESPA1-like [Salarias fasciatus]XP_029947261.1 protein TESPA1-like [Salarias fasciatus]
MSSCSSSVRRRAWINSSRHWSTLEDPDGPLCDVPSASVVDDDVFSDGCFTGKIEDWLLGCGSNSSTENSTYLSFESVQQAGSFTDDLSLGADASVLNGGKATTKPCLKQQPSFERRRRFPSSSRQKGLCPPSLNLGHSIASSCLSSSTWKSTSSVSEILDLYSEDVEETLFDLGFGCEEPQVTVRIPPRFFTFPSQARGINFRLFLDSQLRRIREEDPSLSLASRFRQVQVLTAMANAFYSLYSHVSRTPLQKLETPEFTFCSSPVERMERFRSSIRSEPRSPVERLKDTVNKMCLYPGSPRGSDSTSPQPSPRKRSSLPEILYEVFKNKTAAAKKLDLGEHESDKTKQSVADADSVGNENKVEDKPLETESSGESCIKQTEFDSRTVRTSPPSALSRETVIETGQQFVSCRAESDSHLPHDTKIAELRPVAKVTYDLICPQITESVHQARFCCQNTQSLPHISSEAESKDKSRPHEPQTQAATSDDVCTEVATGEEALTAPVQENRCRDAQCSITVTGWEGDDASCSLNTAAHASPLQTCERQFLNPHDGLGRLATNLQQVNSFELEEVHSAGEEDFGHPATTRGATSPSSIQHHRKGEVVRGDSVQSDSSGYADEEVGPQSGRHT